MRLGIGLIAFGWSIRICRWLEVKNDFLEVIRPAAIAAAVGKRG
jgi:hypothetical protein